MKVTVPDGAIGHVGMVAALKRVAEPDVGKLVIVCEPAGFVTSLVGSVQPVFAWLAQSLGEPIDCQGRSSRTLYVADRCLIPLTGMSAAETSEIIRSQNQADFDAALEHAGVALDAHEIGDDEFEKLLAKAAEQAFVGRSLEVVATPVALQEVGFRPVSGTEGSLLFTGLHEGVELQIHADPEWISNWRLTGISHSPRHAQYTEKVLPNELPRGEIVRAVLDC